MKPNFILKWMGLVSKNTGVRENQTKENLPKCVYAVYDTDRRWICGMFYNRDAAVSYTGGSKDLIVREYPVQ